MLDVPQPPSWLSWLTYRRVGLIVGGAALVGLGIFALKHNPAGDGRPLHPFGGRDDWWRNHRTQPQRSCYRTKAAALQAFRDVNREIIEEWGGLDRKDSPAEYDAVNHRRGLTGKRAARSLSQAMWASMPSRPPFCLDQFDLDALNDTSPGRIGSGFRLPDWTHERDVARRQRDHERALRPPRGKQRADLEPAPF
jgi:hypothetical protein